MHRTLVGQPEPVVEVIGADRRPESLRLIGGDNVLCPLDVRVAAPDRDAIDVGIVIFSRAKASVNFSPLKNGVALNSCIIYIVEGARCLGAFSGTILIPPGGAVAGAAVVGVGAVRLLEPWALAWVWAYAAWDPNWGWD